MRLRNRFLLVGFGVVIFLLITPFLVLYARGFKIDWSNRALVKTGTLVVKTEPVKVEIYLNDEKQDSVSPANIRLLLPGDYNIRLEKENYQPWTKRLSVRSQLVTWTNSNRDFVTLFLKNPIEEEIPDDFVYEPDPILNSATEINQILEKLTIPIPEFSTGEIIRHENQIYLILDQTLYLVNDQLEKIYTPVNHARINTSSGSLLYANDNEVYLYYPEWKTSDLILRSTTQIKNPVHNPETGYVFFQNESKIKTIELDNRDHQNAYTLVDALDNFVLSEDGKELYTISADQIKYYIIR